VTDQIQPKAHVAAQLIRPRPGHRHVFAYDALMVEDRIRELCPEPKFAMTARYLSKRWIINDEGVGTLVPRRDFVVWGVVWEITDVAQMGLEMCMAVPGIYDRYGSFARGHAGELISSEYYGTRNNRTLGLADADYLAPILDAARHWEFQSYLEEIATWARPDKRTLGATSGGR
jgi:hypothetical protein